MKGVVSWNSFADLCDWRIFLVNNMELNKSVENSSHLIRNGFSNWPILKANKQTNLLVGCEPIAIEIKDSDWSYVYIKLT